MKNREILISGASVAGPTLAYWLRRHGFEPTVVERAPAPRPGGQAVDVRGTARDVVERMGIMADVRSAHTGARGMAFVDSASRRRATMDPDGFGDSGGMITDIEILRGDLVRILYEASRRSPSTCWFLPKPASSTSAGAGSSASTPSTPKVWRFSSASWPISGPQAFSG